ncbi:MAG TPA: hypothetical protein VMH35_11295 [Streptosporangiaceae bacterium]|nr:hypothetical protein [Streptosporangiaceae bacterium]
MLASFNRGGFDSTDLGNGAVLTPPALSQPNLSSGCPAQFTCYSFALLRYRPAPTWRRPPRGWSGSPMSTAARPGPAW